MGLVGKQKYGKVNGRRDGNWFGGYVGLVIFCCLRIEDEEKNVRGNYPKP